MLFRRVCLIISFSAYYINSALTDSEFFGYGRLQRFADGLNADTIVNIGKEAFNHQSLGGFGRDSTSLTVENHFGIDRAGGRAMGTSNVVGFDFKPRDRIGTGLI
jgi:hypothetical protein